MAISGRSSGWMLLNRDRMGRRSCLLHEAFARTGNPTLADPKSTHIASRRNVATALGSHHQVEAISQEIGER
jgi:hypothetical protein